VPNSPRAAAAHGSHPANAQQQQSPVDAHSKPKPTQAPAPVQGSGLPPRVELQSSAQNPQQVSQEASAALSQLEELHSGVAHHIAFNPHSMEAYFSSMDMHEGVSKPQPAPALTSMRRMPSELQKQIQLGAMGRPQRRRSSANAPALEEGTTLPKALVVPKPPAPAPAPAVPTARAPSQDGAAKDAASKASTCTQSDMLSVWLGPDGTSILMVQEQEVRLGQPALPTANGTGAARRQSAPVASTLPEIANKRPPPNPRSQGERPLGIPTQPVGTAGKASHSAFGKASNTSTSP
jgi:hypothetical protein